MLTETGETSKSEDTQLIFPFEETTEGWGFYEINEDLTPIPFPEGLHLHQLHRDREQGWMFSFTTQRIDAPVLKPGQAVWFRPNAATLPMPFYVVYLVISAHVTADTHHIHLATPEHYLGHEAVA